MKYPRIMIAGPASGVGKTTIATAIMLAFKEMGLDVQPFKAGPDYIDPMYHVAFSRRPSANLDTWMLSRSSVIELFSRRAQNADISIIEGVMGLYDGIGASEGGSSAQLAKILYAPVVLVLDGCGSSRSLAAIALGLVKFDKKIHIAGAVINNTGNLNHYKHIKQAIENNTGIKVLGCFPKNSIISIEERHLGLTPAVEALPGRKFQRKLLNLAKSNIDIKGILEISRKARPLRKIRPVIFTLSLPVGTAQCAVPTGGVVIAVARDKAFSFYYQDNLDILSAQGIKLMGFSLLTDKNLPKQACGVYIGGGFPELYASQLSRNTSMRAAILMACASGMPIYAECGGLMYLMEKIEDFQKREFPVAGIFKGKAQMGRRLNNFGYAVLNTINDNVLNGKKDENRAHVFHWSYLSGLQKNQKFAYRIKKNNLTFYDGLVKANVLASYAHLHFASNIKLAKKFADKCRKYYEQNYA